MLTQAGYGTSVCVREGGGVSVPLCVFYIKERGGDVGLNRGQCMALNYI